MALNFSQHLGNEQSLANPFPPDHPIHEAWEGATLFAEEQIAFFTAEMNEKLPPETASAKCFSQHLVQFALGVFDIRANSHSRLFSLRKDGARAYEHMLDEIEKALLDAAVRQNWRHIPRQELVAEVKVGLSGRKSHWKGLMFQNVRLAREIKALEDRISELKTEASSATSAGRNSNDLKMEREDFLRRYQKKIQVVGMEALARRLAISVTALRGMTKGDRDRYGEGKLKEVLKKLEITKAQWDDVDALKSL